MKVSLLLISLGFLFCTNSSSTSNAVEVEAVKTRNYDTFHEEAKAFCKANNFNENYYFLLDFSIHSGKNRFFIYDFSNKTFTDKKLVTHGSCDQFQENPDKWEKAAYDVRVNSHCSMKGKYKIGKRDYSSWGIKVKYWLHGLEPSNKTAVERVVVFHSWNAVKNKEIYPRFSPLSWGCPAVSDDFMLLLDERLQAAEKPVLLWIIE
jgi:hypothetical protein